MQLDGLRKQVGQLFPAGAPGVKCFERELAAAGGLACRVDLGVRAIETAKIVGSVGRWNHLRFDFFDAANPTVTSRYARIGQAMRQGKPLPALDVYELRTARGNSVGQSPAGEYYVVDGHHRVAMAKKLGVDFLDARVVLYRVATRTSNEVPRILADPNDSPWREKAK
jgi:hypothetical protein